MNERSIEVVIDAFIIIIGMAVERFITDFPLKHDSAFRLLKTAPRRRPHRRPSPHRKQKGNKFLYWMSYFFSKSQYWLCYGLSLAVIVTLVLRFLIGSDLHLRNAYLARGESQDVSYFAGDIAVLMCFGACIVGAALAKYIRHFAWWLAGCSAVGAVWSWSALGRPDTHGLHELIRWWFKINSVQLGIALLTGALCWFCQARKSKGIVIWGLALFSLWYIVIFPYDLKRILEIEPRVPQVHLQLPKIELEFRRDRPRPNRDPAKADAPSPFSP